ncbi:MobF family relaxase [Kitasatospora sp. NPDC059577]|uniref:MobF family relaxase n=1 Tax=Kitasatospora sp. NPDC059577 TaxID=3346873 RepID=UPI0036920F69
MTVTIHGASSGTGADYLTATVVGDDYRSTVNGLDEYWAGGGDTPGVWIGTQAQALGIAGSLVELEASDAVFKYALNPVTGEKLGRAFPRYTPADVLYERLLAAEPEASESRREKLRVKANREGSRTARSGWEMVYSPVKSFSVLWATADDETRARLEEVEQKAFEKVFARTESEACWTRSGPTAASQVTIRAEGFIAASFIHRSSRAGDPDFHRHLLISAKVRTADGRWLALDARPLHKMTVALSEMYTTEVERGMYEAFGVVAGPRIDTIRPDRRPVREFVGVGPEVVRAYSARRRSTERELEHLTRVFMAREGREPTRVESYALAQSAALSQRPAKQKSDPESERIEWRRRANELGVESPERWLDECAELSRQVDSPRSDPASLSDVVDGVLSTLESSRSAWTRTHVAAETYRQLTATGWHLAAGESFDEVVEEVAGTVLAPAHCAPLNPADTVEVPAEYQRADGTALFADPGAEQYSSHRLRAAEADLLDAALRPVPIARFEPVDIDRVLAAGDRGRGFTPSAEQRAAVHHVLGSDVHVNAVAGPAGTGKSAVVRLLKEAADAREVPVIALTSSQILAGNLAEETGVRTTSTARWRAMSERYASGAGDWTLAPGQIVIVDEAGQASTPDLHAVLRQVQAVDGRLILIGDAGRQGSTGTGALSLIEADAGVARLSEARRFRETGGAIRGWEVEAAQALSLGDDSCYDVYDAHGRIHHGAAEAMLDAVFEAWHRDSAEGLQSVMIAPSDALAAQLSRRAREARITLGEVDDTATVALIGGSRCGVGDRIVTRTNNRKILSEDGRQWVRNGDVWTVGAVGEDGSLRVRNDRTSRQLTLPAEYSAQAVDLAYSVSKDRARELTVDTAHALFDSSLDRDSAYPAATRGRLANHLYLVTQTPGDEAAEPGTEQAARQVFAGILGRDGARYSVTAVERLLARKAASLRTQADRMTYVLDDLADVQARRAVAGLLGERASTQLVGAPAWPALRDQLAGFAEAGFDSDRLLREAFQDPQGNTFDFDGRPLNDLAAILHARAAKVMENESAAALLRLPEGAERPVTAVGHRGAGQARGDDLFRAMGLSLPGADPSDGRSVYLHQLAVAAERRFVQVTETARADAAAGQGWAAVYGPEPADPGHAAVWGERLAAAAAYRDLTGYRGSDPTGPAPGGERSGERGLWRAAQVVPDPVVLADRFGSRPPDWLSGLGGGPARGGAPGGGGGGGRGGPNPPGGGGGD